MKVYGYARISKRSQNIERQIRNILKVHPNAEIIQESYTGRTTNRKGFNQLIKKAKTGDRIIFDSVSRMSRNADEGVKQYLDLYQRGVVLEFIKEPHINTEVYKRAQEKAIPLTGTKVDIILSAVNDYVLELAKEQIELAYQQAQKEVDDLSQRTKEGIETAKINGKQVGRAAGVKVETTKSKSMKKKIVDLSADFNGNQTDKELMELLGLARNTFYKYKKELKEV